MKNLVCVLCGEPWVRAANRCKCGGFCTWGEKKDGPPSSWNIEKNGQWIPKKPPQDTFPSSNG